VWLIVTLLEIEIQIPTSWMLVAPTPWALIAFGVVAVVMGSIALLMDGDGPNTRGV
jgi:hypothetical protein